MQCWTSLLHMLMKVCATKIKIYSPSFFFLMWIYGLFKNISLMKTNPTAKLGVTEVREGKTPELP